MQREFKLNIDINKECYNNLKCNQNEDVNFKISLLKDNVYLDLSNLDFEMYFLNANNTLTVVDKTNISVIKDSNNNDILSIDLPQNCTKSSGVAKFQIEVSSNSKKLYTFALQVYVKESVFDNKQVSQNIILMMDNLKQLVLDLDAQKLTIEQFLKQAEATINTDLANANKDVVDLEKRLKMQ